MSNLIDLVGQRFDRLLVIERAENYISPKGRIYSRWLCQCDCGNPTIVNGQSLKRGSTKSCGCYNKERTKQANIKNLLGKRFGRLLVIEQSESNQYGACWKCLCDCGNEKIFYAGSLISGNTKSCGCLQKEIVTSLRHLNDSGAALNELFGTYKFNAKKRNLLFNITKEKFMSLTKENCYYCGSEPQQILKNNHNDCDNYTYNGIDRIDSSKNYTEDNVVPCCGRCNYMKMAIGQQEFLNHIEKIHNYQKGKNEKYFINN